MLRRAEPMKFGPGSRICRQAALSWQGLTIAHPIGKQIGQRPAYVQFSQLAIDGIVLAPDHIRQEAVSHLFFDVAVRIHKKVQRETTRNGKADAS